MDARTGRRWATAIGLVAFGVFCVAQTMRTQSLWPTVFVQAAVDLREGRDFYHDGTPYVYPPFMAFAALPFVGLPPLASAVAWSGVNLVSLTVAAWGVRACLSAEGMDDRSAGIALGAGAAIVSPAILDCVTNGQVDLPVNALVIAGCGLWCQNRSVRAALLWGGAAACKATPLLWAVPLVLRRQWVALAALIGICVAANVLPDFVAHPPEQRTWVERWYVRFIVPLTRSDYIPGTWGSEVVYNQSLAGAWQRWVKTRPVWADQAMTVANTPPRLDASAFRTGDQGIKFAALGILTLVLAFTSRRHSPSAQCGLVLAFMLLLSPMSSKPHFSTLALPAALVFARWRERRSPALFTALLVASISGLAMNRDLVGKPAYIVALWSGVVMWQAIALAAAASVVLFQRQRVKVAPALSSARAA